MRTRTKNLIIAHHEAGHAVVARRLGMSVSYAKIVVKNNKVMSGNVRHFATNKHGTEDGYLAMLESQIIVQYAGMSAEDRLFEEKNIVFDEDIVVELANAVTHDQDQIDNLLDMWVSARTGIIKANKWKKAEWDLWGRLNGHLRRQSEIFVGRNWSAIKRVARALLKKGRLSQATIDALISKR
jgi:hypothetical protein